MSNELTILRVVPVDPPTGLRLVGEVDVSNRPVLRQALAACDGADEVHLHLGELQFIDVAGATELVHHAAALGPARRMVLHDPPRMLPRMIDLLWGPQRAIALDT
jgi:anti-anti-sigma regulatory factor